MGHIGHLKEEYEALVERLEGGQVSMPRPKNPLAVQGWQEILEILFTPEEAQLAVKMPVRPSSLRALAERFAMSEAEARGKLDAMADKGVVLDLIHPDTGKERWVLAPPVVGFLEFSLMRTEGHDSIPKKQMARALEAYLHGDDTFAQEVFGGDTVVGRALVHESGLGDDQVPEVLGFERATALIEEASLISVTNCYCRHKEEHLGHRCEAPMENCLSLNLGADFVIRRRFGREIEKAQALELLAEAREHGLVQIADNILDQPTYLCNCCGCCCGQLRAINEFDIPGAVNPSGFVPKIALDTCKGCSKCARACPIKAIHMRPERIANQRKSRLVPTVDLDRCIGCGVCADTCRRRALRMRRSERRPHIPQTAMERMLRMAIERGHLAHLLADQGAGRGMRFLNQLIQALVALPPAQRQLANEQLRSRFVNFVLGKVKDPTASPRAQ